MTKHWANIASLLINAGLALQKAFSIRSHLKGEFDFGGIVNDNVRHCAECIWCRYTRNCRKKGPRYYFYRLVQWSCPFCHGANSYLGYNFQVGKRNDRSNEGQ